MSFLDQTEVVERKVSEIDENTYEWKEYLYIVAMGEQPVINEPRYKLRASNAGFCPIKDILTQNQKNSVDSLSGLLFKEIGLTFENVTVGGMKHFRKLIVAGHKIDSDYLEKNFDLGLTGTSDFVYYDHDNLPTLGECKSVGSVAEYKLKLQHQAQALTYAGVFGLSNVNILVYGRRVIEAFPHLALKIFNIKVTDAVLLDTFTKVYFSDLCLKNGKIPKRNPKFRKTIECYKCPVIDTCLSNVSNLSIEEEADFLNRAKEKATRFVERREELSDKFLKETGISY